MADNKWPTSIESEAVRRLDRLVADLADACDNYDELEAVLLAMQVSLARRLVQGREVARG